MKSLLVLLLAACSTTSGPQMVDPSMQLINRSASQTGRIIFATDQSGALMYDTVSVAPLTTVCARWTQSFDSLYVRVEFGVQQDTVPGRPFGNAISPWVRLNEYPNYFQSDTITANNTITGGIVTQEC